MKITSILLFILGVITTIYLITFYNPRINAADSDPMTVSPSGNMVAEWPLFIGIILIFVGGVFFYISQTEKK